MLFKTCEAAEIKASRTFPHFNSRFFYNNKK